jgi:type I restriction enzyme M protein
MAKIDTSTFEQKLFKSADKLRKNIDAAEYKHVVLGLIFLKYISESFGELYDKLKADEYSDPEDRDEYLAANTFFVPKEARWSHIHANAKLPTIGQTIDEAMEAIEKENKELKNVLPQVYGRANLDKTSLGELIDLISNTELQAENTKSKDLFGRVYEYFLGEFANAEGKKGGQFYTPKSIVKLMVEMIEPYKGRVYDPASGSGGMFVMSEKFVTEHRGNIKDITVYGQESNQTTWKLSKMNLAIRNINSKFVAWNTEGTFLKDAHPDLKADFILANPPFNQKEWGIDILQEDGRWKYGTPPDGNANYGWIEHMLYHLAPRGVMATILSNGSLSTNTSGEGEIRKNLIENDLVECIVALPKQLFYNTSIPACIWILRREKSNHSREVLFIDASEMGYMIDNVRRELDEKEIKKITETYHKWKKTENFQNIQGFCKSAKLEEIQKNNYTLSPSRYVGIIEVVKDSIDFNKKMDLFKFHFETQSKHYKSFDEKISSNLNTYYKHINWNSLYFSSPELLTQLVQQLFTNWFVEFEFPNIQGLPYKSSGGKMIMTEFGEIPEGWKVNQLGNLCYIIDCLHSKKPERLDHNTGNILLQLNNITDIGIIDFKEKFYISDNDYKNWTSRIELLFSDCVITNVGRYGAVSQMPNGFKAAIGRNITAIRLKKEFNHLGYFLITLLTSNWMKREIEINKDAGTILDALNVKSIPNLKFLDPGDSLLKEFETLINPIRRKIESMCCELELFELIKEKENKSQL